MGQTNRHFRLSEGDQTGRFRFCSDRLDGRQLAEGKRDAWVTITRTGLFHDPRYGEFEITLSMLQSMVQNFETNVVGQRIPLDVSHRPQDGAAGYFKKLDVEQGKLRGLVEFTEYGIDAVKKRGMIYLSAEFHENYMTNESPRRECGPTLLGAGLTPRPVIKNLDPVQLSEEALDGAPPTFVTDRFTRILSEEIRSMWEKLKKQLAAKLGSMKLAEAVVARLVSQFVEAGTKLAISDEEKAKELMEGFVATGEQLAKQLAESGTAEPATIHLSVPGPSGLSQDDVKRLLAEHQAEQEKQAKTLAETKDARVGQFRKALDECEGLKDLSEEQRKELAEFEDLISAETTEEQVQKLAERAIAVGEKLAVSTQLASMGFDVGGSVHLSVDESNTVKKLQEEIISGLRGSYVHSTGQLRLAEKVHPFVDKVLGEFDRLNGRRLHEEAKILSGGTTGMGDTSLPAGFQRTVIREALSDLRVLELLQTLTDPAATVTTGIPYESRDTSAIQNGGIVYEGQGIHRASVSQAMDYAYILPMKLAFIISNEVMHFSRANQINWDAYARNVESNARVMRELIVVRICNELQRASDAYLAATVANEDVASQLDGATVSTIKTAEFPIVRPHQQTDLQGNNVGSEENPLTVRLNGVAIDRYDGTGSQSAGTYYRVTNYNLGYIQFVDESGSPVTPAASAGADDVSYSYATNVAKFDLDNGATDLDLHLNGLLRAIGARKAVMSSDRFVSPDFLLMSPVLNDTATNARQFEAQAKRNGSDTNGQGDLDMLKGVPAWSTNAPGVDLGDERILMGQRGTATYTVAKPFMTGEPFEATDASGNPTGQKQAYGEEYSAIKVPTALRNRLTSVLAYSASAR